MSLLLALGLAFLGGLILNAMPCVFPILSLKVLTFATGDPAEHRRHGLAYLSGVVASFVLIASVLISLQSAGRWVGWGFQLQSTGFVIALAYLFAVMGLSLSGLVLFGGRWMNLGAGLATAPGTRGSFFTGVLAVVVASPCTAPFMGTALGFALTQPPLEALAVFASLGVGMAAPMVAISMSDTARRWLPKPGPWMETLKQVMAFPLYLTAVWLLWVAGKQSGVDAMAAAAAGVVLLALGLMLLRGGSVARVIAVVCMMAAMVLGGVRGEPSGTSGKAAREGTVAWSPERLQSLQAQGTPVFVDVTADWCITCLANEQAVLFTDDMTRAFEEAGVTYMVADWTNYDPVIGAFVREHGRNGIPLYVLYSGNRGKAPVILPQLLTRNIVMEALAGASE
jgi:thiol:disulfide interchange protein DsbD